MPAATSFNWRGLLKEDLLAKLCRDNQDKAERLIMETGRVFEDVIADSSAQLGVLGTGKDTEKSYNLCSFTDQMLAQLAVLRNMKERGLSLAETAR